MAVYKFSYVLRMECDPPLYVWTGFGPLVTPADSYDPSGATWIGAGEILSIPDIKQFINGAAGRYDFSFSGVSMETVRLSTEDRPSVNGASVMIGRVNFDADRQLAGGVEWEWEGAAGTIVTDSSSAEGGNRTRTISLSVASEDTRRSDPQITFYTPDDQRKRSPTDRFCDFVPSLSIEKTRRFGPR